MVENSIDAKATTISIYLLNSGLDQIRIIDDGCGIDKEDFGLLCERFATSKINCVQDLSNLFSFGFRGEALASISYVSILSVQSKRKENEIGFTASFKDSHIIDDKISPIGCSDGTEFKVDSLFYNLKQRRESIHRLEERKSILKMIQSLSLNHNQISFKLFFDKNNEFSTKHQNERLDLIG